MCDRSYQQQDTEANAGTAYDVYWSRVYHTLSDLLVNVSYREFCSEPWFYLSEIAEDFDSIETIDIQHGQPLLNVDVQNLLRGHIDVLALSATAIDLLRELSGHANYPAYYIH